MNRAEKEILNTEMENKSWELIADLQKFNIFYSMYLDYLGTYYIKYDPLSPWRNFTEADMSYYSY